MPTKQPSDTAPEKVKIEVVSPRVNKDSYKAVTAVSTKSTKAPTATVSEFEDFIKSEEFLGDKSLFVRYSFIEDENEIFNTQNSSAPDEVLEAFETPTGINNSNGSDFNLNLSDNLIASANDTLLNEEFQKFLSSLPNQIKALFLYRLDFVKKITGVQTNDLINNLKTQAAVNVNYFKLVTFEMFDKYDTTTSGEIMINAPLFKPLKEADLNSLSSPVLCRIKRMYNNNLKIGRDILSFPIEGQYFYITPDNFIPPSSTATTYTQEARNISIRHFISKNYNLIGATSNIITQPGDTVDNQPSIPSDNTLETGTTTIVQTNTTSTDGGGY